jgi:hypothetical protein
MFVRNLYDGGIYPDIGDAGLIIVRNNNISLEVSMWFQSEHRKGMAGERAITHRMQIAMDDSGRMQARQSAS